MAVSPSVINKIKWVLFRKTEPTTTSGILWAKPEGEKFAFYVYDDGTWKSIEDGTGIIMPEISTSISAFDNDAGYLTAVDLSGYSTTEEMNAAIQQALASYYTKTEADTLLGSKQDTLVSGTNIKTINNQSILGSGNITIQGGGSSVQSDWNQTDTEADDYIKNKPTNVSSFTNDAGYLTQHQSLDNYYTKTEVNGLVDTPHQEYITVDAYSNLPVTGSNDTIYRVSNYNGSTSQVDASVYSEYAWNGTQYIFLCVKSQIGEVFDISVYNNNTKYADLAAALNGGANIPQSLQKGGMSIKFIQSSDNKYVQARLMADSFTTDVTQWQCVDDEPTVFSNNLVKSNGIARQLNTILPSKDENISYNNSILTINGYGLNVTNGTPKAYSSYKISDYIEIPTGTHTIQYSGLISYSSGYIPICIYDENKEYLYCSKKSSAYTIPVLNNAKYVRVAGTTAVMQLVFTYRNISEFDNINGYVLQSELDINIAHLSGLITTSGAITTGGSYSVSIPFSIKDFDKVSFTLTSVAQNYCSVFFYNKEGDELVPIKGFKTIGTYEYDVSYFGDDVYVRISYGYVTVQLKKEKVGIEEKLEDCVNTEEFTSLSEKLYGEEEQHTKTYNADSVELTFESGALLKAGGFDNQGSYKHSNLIPITKDVLSIEYTNAFDSTNNYCGVQLYAGDDLIAVNVPSGNGTFLMSEYLSATSVRFMTEGGCYLTFTIFNKGDINYLQEEINELSGKGSGTNIVGHTRNKVAYFFGDSLTYGAFGGGYVGRVKLKLGLSTAQNYGVNGATASGVKSVVTDANKDYSACDIVCIMVGTNHRGMTNAGDIEKDIPKLCLTSLTSEDYPYTYNDSSTTVQTAVLDNENDYFTKLFPSTFIGQVSACVEYVQYKNPYCRIYLIAPYITAIGTAVHDAIPIVREALLEIGARYGVPVIDVCGKCNINDKTAATYLNASDGVHPTAAGNIAMANYISRYISLDYIEPDE